MICILPFVVDFSQVCFKPISFVRQPTLFCISLLTVAVSNVVVPRAWSAVDRASGRKGFCTGFFLWLIRGREGNRRRR